MSEPSNPYDAPKSNIIAAGDSSLASPWIRLGAALIDGIVLVPINWLLQKFLVGMPSIEEQTAAFQKGGLEAQLALMPGAGKLLLAQLLGLAIFIAVNFVFLKKGQTIGKMALKLQIQNRDTGALLPIQDLLLRRVLPLYVVAALGASIHWSIGLLIIVDALCIFRPGRNTLHDDLANTKVVKLPG